MTANKDLKKRIRARQEKTGESYVTARRHVLAAAPGRDEPAASAPADAAPVPAEAPAPSPPPPAPTASPAPVRPKWNSIELANLTAHAATLGIGCMVFTTPSVVDPHGVLAHLVELLQAGEADPDMATLRTVILRGTQIPFPPPQPDSWWESVEEFLRRAHAGTPGISPGGFMLAFPHRDRMVLANIGYRPRLMLSDLADDGDTFSLLTHR